MAGGGRARVRRNRRAQLAPPRAPVLVSQSQAPLPSDTPPPPPPPSSPATSARSSCCGGLDMLLLRPPARVARQRWRSKMVAPARRQRVERPPMYKIDHPRTCCPLAGNARRRPGAHDPALRLPARGARPRATKGFATALCRTLSVCRGLCGVCGRWTSSERAQAHRVWARTRISAVARSCALQPRLAPLPQLAQRVPVSLPGAPPTAVRGGGASTHRYTHPRGQGAAAPAAGA